MSSFHSEGVAWVDPYVFSKAGEHLFDDDDDEQQAIKTKLTEMSARREKRSLPLSVLTKTALVQPQAVIHPVDFRSSPGDRTAPQYFTHVAVSNNTVVAVTKNNTIHFFDQTNEIPVTSLSMVGSTQTNDKSAAIQKLMTGAADVLTGAAGVIGNAINLNIPGVLPQQQMINCVDAKDFVTKLFLDPMGRHAVVVFASGINLLYHIKHADAEDDTQDAVPKSKKQQKKKKKAEDAAKPHRFDIVFGQDISQAPSFCVESIAWDEQNTYEMSTGDVILGSQKHGSIVTCRFESTGVSAAKHLFTFPSPMNRTPIHSLAMMREAEGLKRTVILVAVDHKLFFFRSTRNTLESAFSMVDLQVPDTEAELAYLAAAGATVSLPLKNFWALPATSGPSSTSSSGGATATSSSAAGSANTAASPRATLDMQLPVSRVVIHSPQRTYANQALPVTFIWTYYDSIVQGVIVPFDDDAAGGGEERGKKGTLFSVVREYKKPGGSGASSTTQNILTLMRKSVRITSVDTAQRLVGAAEYALQLDLSAQAPTFTPTTVVPPTVYMNASSPKGPTLSSPSGVVNNNNNNSSVASASAPITQVFTTNEKVLRISSTYFYLIIATQTKVYVFAHPSCIPLPSTSSPWEVRNRLVQQISLLNSSTLSTPLVTVSTSSANPTAAAGSGAPAVPFKLPPNTSTLYKVPDGCLEVVRDARYINKLYLCLAREILELSIPSLKRQFVGLLVQATKSAMPPSVTDSHFVYPSAVSPSGKISVATVTTSSVPVFHYRLTPPVAIGTVTEDFVRAGATQNVRFAPRERSGTVMPTNVASYPRVSGRGGAGVAAGGDDQPQYASLAFMRLFAASRLPVRSQLRSHALCSECLFNVALTMSAKQPDLHRSVQSLYGEYLYNTQRYVEAAARLGRYGRQSGNVWFTRFSGLSDKYPLLLFCLTRLRLVTDNGRSMHGSGMIEAACLGNAISALLFDRCTATSKALSLNAEGTSSPIKPAGASNSSAVTDNVMKQYKLDNPSLLLKELLEGNKDLLSWPMLRSTVFHIASEDEVFVVCRALDQHKELLQYLLAHSRYFDALELILERSKKEYDESLCYDEDGYIHPGVAANLWESYGGVFLRHCPVRMIRSGWVPYGAEIGLDPLRMLPILARYDTKFNETIFEAEGDAEEVRRWQRGQREPRNDAAQERSDSTIPASDRETCPEHMGIVYLKHLVREGYTERVISNLLLKFLSVSGSDDELVSFIASDKSLDLHYALRVCNQHQRPPAVIQIYFSLGHLHEAIDLALEHNEVSRAKKLVESVKDNTPGAGDAAHMRRELWRKIVACVAKQQFGPKNALHIISESQNDVNVSHVIPHLSDDVMLSEFKTELLENVADFGRLMRVVKEDIEQSKNDVELLRGDVISARRGTIKVPGSKKCDACSSSVWGGGRGEPVFFRGCTHGFHSDCLAEQWKAANVTSACDGQVRDELECFLCAPVALKSRLTAPLSGTSQTLYLPW